MNHRPPAALHDERTFGQRMADHVSALCGSWLFIWGYIGSTAVWCLGNIIAWTFDRFPFQFYTFGVSVLAILMSAIILLAGNRIAQIDRTHAENAYAHVDDVNSKQDEQLRILLAQDELMKSQHQAQLEALKSIDDKTSAIIAELIPLTHTRRP